MARRAPIANQKSAPGKHLLVTGGGGYVGNALCKRIIDEGHSLTVWGRTRPASLAPELYQFYSYDLSGPLPVEGLVGVDAVLHLAHDMNDTEESKINERATKLLRAAVRQHPGAGFVYISSQSAQKNAPSPYGRVKWQIEKLMDGPRESIVSPGFVYGGATSGSFGVLVRLLSKLRVFPVVGSKTLLQPVHIDDLCKGLVKIACSEQREKRYRIAAPEPVTFSLFLQNLARHRLGRRVLFIPVPTSLALLGAWLCRMVPGLPNIPSDRITGLTRIALMDTAADLARLNLMPRSLISGLQERKTASRRPLIKEGQVLLHYISGRKPTRHWVRRYVRALIAQGLCEPISLPFLSFVSPAFVRLSEPMPGSSSDLRRRLDIAISVAEMSPEGAKLFAAYEPSSRIITISRLALELVIEVALLPLRMLRR